MRIALIAMADRAGGDQAEPVTVAGRSIAAHQLDFALALRCGKIVCLGNGAAPEAIALRYQAEAAGAQFQVVRGVRDLPAAVRSDDELMVFARGLLPESPRAFALLGEGHCVLVLPAEAGWSAGFERLDLAAAWGGAMVIPGRLADRLDQLPEDAEPIAGLLRIARQAGVAERALPESELAEGRWQIVRTAEAGQALESAWLRRRLPPASPFRPTAWIARFALRRLGSAMIGRRRAIAAGSALAVAAMGSAVALAWVGIFAGAFAALALAALATEGVDALIGLGRSIFDVESKPSRLIFALRMIWDAALVATGFLAIDGSRAQRLFPPLIVAGLLRTQPAPPVSGWRALAGDRGALVVLLSLAAAFGLAEGAFMLAALNLVALCIAPAAEHQR